MRTPEEIYDEWLVLRCQDGEAEALTHLARRWHPRMVQLARKLCCNPADAEDVAQTAWLTVVKKIHTLRDPASLKSWLFRIVSNRCADLARDRQRRQSRALQHEPEAHEETVNQESAGDARQRRLKQALYQLDEDKQIVMSMHYLQGMSVQQIARVLSLPHGTVKSRLHYGRSKLREAMKGETDE